MVRSSGRTTGRDPLPASRRGLAAGLLVWAILSAWAPSALALPGDGPAHTRTRDDGVLTIAVVGDSLADGIWGGLQRRLGRNDRIDVLRLTRNSTGLARPDYYDWPVELEKVLAKGTIDAVVVALGLNDTQEVWIGGRRRFDFGTPEWNEVYVSRVDAMMAVLTEARVQAFWVGLPVIRDPDLSDQVRHISAIFEVRAAQHDIPFVPLWDLTTGEDGEFTSYLKDKDGRSRPMRMKDGIHFTGQGYTMLANQLLGKMRPRLPSLTADVAGD